MARCLGSVRSPPKFPAQSQDEDGPDVARLGGESPDATGLALRTAGCAHEGGLLPWRWRRRWRRRGAAGPSGGRHGSPPPRAEAAAEGARAAYMWADADDAFVSQAMALLAAAREANAYVAIERERGAEVGGGSAAAGLDAGLAVGAVDALLRRRVTVGGGGGGGGGSGAGGSALDSRGAMPSFEYLVRWAGLPLSRATWEPRATLERACGELVKAFDAAVLPGVRPLPGLQRGGATAARRSLRCASDDCSNAHLAPRRACLSRRLGATAVGLRALVRWDDAPGQWTWYAAVVTGYDPRTCAHTITYMRHLARGARHGLRGDASAAAPGDAAGVAAGDVAGDASEESSSGDEMEEGICLGSRHVRVMGVGGPRRRQQLGAVRVGLELRGGPHVLASGGGGDGDGSGGGGGGPHRDGGASAGEEFVEAVGPPLADAEVVGEPRQGAVPELVDEEAGGEPPQGAVPELVDVEAGGEPPQGVATEWAPSEAAGRAPSPRAPSARDTPPPGTSDGDGVVAGPGHDQGTCAARAPSPSPAAPPLPSQAAAPAPAPAVAAAQAVAPAEAPRGGAGAGGLGLGALQPPAGSGDGVSAGAAAVTAPRRSLWRRDRGGALQ